MDIKNVADDLAKSVAPHLNEAIKLQLSKYYFAAEYELLLEAAAMEAIHYGVPIPGEVLKIVESEDWPWPWDAETEAIKSYFVTSLAA